MGFGKPEHLWLLLLTIPLVALFVHGLRRRRRFLEIFCSLPMMRRLSRNSSMERRIIKAVLSLIVFLMIVLAFARPQWGTRLEKIERKGVDVIIAIDTSSSMLAEDIKPNRLEKAKLELSSFIDKLRGDRVGLVAFAGAAYLQCPLTLDHNAVKVFLDVIDHELIPLPGTAIGDAMELAVDAFEGAKKKHKVLVLLTDGEDHGSDPMGNAEKAKEEGIIVYTIGIGSPKGELIPERGQNGSLRGYKKDNEGEIVHSRLDQETLMKIASITGGKFFRATPSEMELDSIAGR